MSEKQHARYFSASSAHRWILCPGSVALSLNEPNRDSKFSLEGTSAHDLGARCLTDGVGDPFAYVGQTMEGGFVVDQAMAEYIREYVETVRDYADGHTLLVEQRVDFSDYIGAEEGFGTSDVIILAGDELVVGDLKYGRGVEVSAYKNEQLMLYALGALRKYEMLGDFKRVRLFIHQPRIESLSEWDLTIDELLAFSQTAKLSAMAVNACLSPGGLLEDNLNPGDKQCRFCPSKARCNALANFVMNQLTDDFVDLDSQESVNVKLHGAAELLQNSDNERLAILMPHLDLIEGWCKAVRGKVESELIAGRPVRGWKIVEGKKGNRKWSDEVAASIALQEAGLKEDDLYESFLRTPAALEKTFKKNKDVAQLIPTLIAERANGKPSVAPESDKRPAIKPQDISNDFTDLSAEDSE